MTAVTTPTGISPSIRATRSAKISRSARPRRRQRQDEAGVRPDDEAHDVRHDQADEADEPAHGHRGRRHERREAEQDRPLAADVDAQVRGRLLAQQQPVERPRPQQDEHAPEGDERQRRREARPGRRRRSRRAGRRRSGAGCAPERYIAIASPAASSEPTA